MEEESQMAMSVMGGVYVLTTVSCCKVCMAAELTIESRCR